MKGAIRQLGEICRFEYGSSLPADKREDGPHPVFGSNGPVGMHAEPLTEGPTIIVGRKGSAGSVNYSAVPCFPIDTTYFIDQKTAKCDLKWLFYALENLGLNRLNQAAAVPGLNRNLAYTQNLFVPDSPDDQKRIAATLDKADLIRRKRQQALRLTDDFLRSVFLDMFGDLMTNPLGWPIKPLSEGVAEFEGGRNVMPTDTLRADGVRVLKVSAVTSGEYKPHESKSFDAAEQFPDHYIVREGDLLISRANTSELVGAAAYVWETKGKEMLPDKLWRFVWPEERTIEPLFMLHLARSRYFREQLIQRATGSSGSMKNIGKAKMLEIPIPFPPIDLQRTFSQIAMRSRLASESSAASMKQAEDLFASLQQRAFSGQL